MTKVTILKPDDMIYLDGTNYEKDFSGWHTDLHALQFDTVTEAGEIEWKNPQRNQVVSSEDEVNNALSCNLSDLIDSCTVISAEFTALSADERKIFALETVRDMRNSLLQQSDWRALPENSAGYTDAWKAYRQSLKDIPEDIASGDTTAPTFNDAAELQFTWPDAP